MSGPLAFPSPIAVGPAGDVYDASHLNSDWHGMELRDWFAGQALSAIISADGIQYASSSAKQHAQLAYEHADAMLKARDVVP